MSRMNFKERKHARREEAIIRQDLYNASTTQTKIVNCKRRRGESKKELQRLYHG